MRHLSTQRVYKGEQIKNESFGVAEHYYISAIELLSSLELEVIIEDFGKTDKGREIKQIIRHYRDMSETQITKVK